MVSDRYKSTGAQTPYPCPPLSLSSPPWSKSSSTKTEASRERDCTLEICHPSHEPKNAMCVLRNSPGTLSQMITPFGSLPRPPGARRLNHLKRHLLTRKSRSSSTRNLRLINRICPDTDLRKHECEVSRLSRCRTSQPVLSGSIRDVTSNSPEETSSQSTCEYAANRTFDRPPIPMCSAHVRSSKVKSPKSRRKSCAPCALAKCKCDLQQPCSCCIAKKKECIFTDTKSVTAVKVTPADVPETECSATPSASSDITFTPDALIPSDLKSCVAEKHPDERYPLDVSSDICLAAPPDLTISNQSWLDDTGQFADQYGSSCLQDIFFDWNIPFGCSPLDFTSTFSPIYTPTEATPLGIISDPTQIVTPSAYLEPSNAQQSASELKRYCKFLISRVSSQLTTRSQSSLL